MIFVDSNVLIDLFDPQDEQWSAWSQRQIEQLPPPLVANSVVLAEVSLRFAALEQLTGFMSELEVTILNIPASAAFAAGKAHAAYRRRGGSRENILADALIGGHAATLGATLLTRDRGRFATYFPELALITPETHHG